MNTVKSFWLGWGSLIVAGGGAYYYAKKEINADRRAKHLRMQQQQYENQMLYGDHSVNPSTEATADPAPTRHAPETTEHRVREKSKYEASEPYQSPKGDRFS